MDHYDQGATYEDIHGEVLEHEAYLDAIDKQICSEKCYFSYMDMHRYGCPLFSKVDEDKEWKTEQAISQSLGK